MKIVNVDNVYISPPHLKELEAFGEIVTYHDIPIVEAGIARIKDANIIISSWLHITAEALQHTPNLQFICKAAVGYNDIDLVEAKKRNIVVSNCPGYSTQAVAEHTIGLMLAASRHTTASQRAIREGKYSNTAFQGKQLHGKTLGIIGYGAIGKRVGEIAQQGFGMKIITLDSKFSPADFDQLLHVADIISVHAPLTDATRGLLGEKEFTGMKSGVIIINTARGPIIDEAALIKYLSSGKIFAAGLDVYTKEPLEKTSPLLSLPNVVCTSHIAWNTEESQEARSQIIVDNIRGFITGKPQNEVT